MKPLNTNQETLEKHFRAKVKDAFESALKEIETQLTGVQIFDDLIIRSAIGNTRKALLDVAESTLSFFPLNFSPEDIIEEECTTFINKHFNF
ncbi:hypothetical protein [Prevotellamassilia timonensis]|jgi:hypothetical protein|uniref:hypothetical protein n=1 Tax=Prevotellamassilia timonensis TaxID=1852370 RepID=UPI00307F916A